MRRFAKKHPTLFSIVLSLGAFIVMHALSFLPLTYGRLDSYACFIFVVVFLILSIGQFYTASLNKKQDIRRIIHIVIAVFFLIGTLFMMLSGALLVFEGM